MTTSAQHHDHAFADFVSAAAAVCDELDAADEAEDLESHVGWITHSCEPDYQVLVELISPAPQVSLQLVIDLDVDATVDSAQVIGTVEGESFTTVIELDAQFLMHLVEHHFAPAARTCGGCVAPDAMRPPTWR